MAPIPRRTFLAAGALSLLFQDTYTLSQEKSPGRPEFAKKREHPSVDDTGYTPGGMLSENDLFFPNMWYENTIALKNTAYKNNNGLNRAWQNFSQEQKRSVFEKLSKRLSDPKYRYQEYLKIRPGAILFNELTVFSRDYHDIARDKNKPTEPLESLVGLESKDLKWSPFLALTDGTVFFDFSYKPSSVTAVEYQDKMFVLSQKNKGKILIRKGGLSHESQRKHFNYMRPFDFILPDGSTVTVNENIFQLSKGSSLVLPEFLAPADKTLTALSDDAVAQVLSNNRIFIQDIFFQSIYGNLTSPTRTEVSVGILDHTKEKKQYVWFSPNSTKVVGKGLTIEVITDQEEVVLKGDDLTLKNGDLIVRLKDKKLTTSGEDQKFAMSRLRVE